MKKNYELIKNFFEINDFSKVDEENIGGDYKNIIYKRN